LNVERVLDSLNLDWMRALLLEHYHHKGPGRNPFDPSAMFKAQLLKHLLQIPSDRRLALRLRRNRRLAKACGFRRRRTPSHGLFTQFRLRLGEEAYQLVFSRLARTLIESGAMIGKVVAVDSTTSQPTADAP
jgi:transposase